MNDLNVKGRLVQMVQLNTCTSQLETPRVQEHARTQDLATARSGGDRSWSRAQTAGMRWHMRGGSGSMAPYALSVAHTTEAGALAKAI